MTLTFPNGSVLWILGADKPDSLRGPNPRGVVLDEYGDMKSEIWGAIVQPIMMANPAAWTWFAGTPKGRNDFHKKFAYASQGKDKNWFCSLLKASESGIIRPDMLAEARETTTQAYYEQEYECEFIDSATSFFRRIKQCIYTDEHPVIDRRKLTFHMGIDLAKYDDWTVITPFCLNDFRVYDQVYFNQIDWNIQKSRIETEYLRYHRPRVKIDSTGLGDPIVDDLLDRGVDIDKEKGDNFKFTENSRRQLLDNLSILIEQGRIRLPNDERLLLELESFQYTLTERGKIKVQVPDGMHDDRVMSLALAVWDSGLNPLGMPKPDQDELMDRFNRYSVI